MSDSRMPGSGVGPDFETEYLADAEIYIRRGMPLAFALLALTFLLYGAAHLSSGGRGPQSALVDVASAVFMGLCAAILRFTRLGRVSIIVPAGLVGAMFGSSLSSVVRLPMDPIAAQGVSGFCMLIVALAIVTPRTRDSVRWAVTGIAAIAVPEILVRTFHGTEPARLAMIAISFCVNFYVAGYLEQIRRRDFGLRSSYQAEARTDALTGLINRRCFVELYQREVARLQRQGRSFAVAMVDIDHFKAINDRYGHQTGDDVLKGMARLLGGKVRATDLLARWGGEEFAVLFSELSGEAGLASAERIRAAVQTQPLAPGDYAVTVSIGVTAVDAPENVESVIARADAALYRAKRNGRNRVEFEPVDARHEVPACLGHGGADFAKPRQAAT